jgi:uncharacterized protein Yka (UPF0111/DUF47 family)
MFKSILPKEYSFFNYFEQHIELCTQSAYQLVQITEDFSKFKDASEKIKKLTVEMDAITHKCVEALLVTFITPFERTDIHRLIKRIDDIADGINSAVSRIRLYHIYELKPEVKPIAVIIHKSVQILAICLKELRSMKNAEKIKINCDEIRKLENECDEIFKDSLAKLFESGDAIELIKWKEILERFEKVVDKCELSANIIESIVIASA